MSETELQKQREYHRKILNDKKPNELNCPTFNVDELFNDSSSSQISSPLLASPITPLSSPAICLLQNKTLRKDAISTEEGNGQQTFSANCGVIDSGHAKGKETDKVPFTDDFDELFTSPKAASTAQQHIDIHSIENILF